MSTACESSVDIAWRATIAACIGGIEHREPVLARLLGRVHRDVGVAQQVVGLVALLEAGGDADAGRHLQVLPVDRERDGERGDEARRDGHRGAELRLVEQQDRELVAAEAGGHVAGADARLDAVGDRGEQPVAGRVPEGVVDVLEVVEVEEQDDRDPVGGRVLDRAVDLLGEQAAVGEAGQRVVVGLEPELLLEPRQLRQRLLQLAVLEGDGRLVGERLEEPQVVVGEGRPLGQPVRDDHRPDQPGLAEQRRGHRVADLGVAAVGRDVEERPVARARRGGGGGRRRRAGGGPSSSGSRSCSQTVSRPSSTVSSRGHSSTSARSARNISRACSSRAASAESSSGECWRIRLDWYSSSSRSCFSRSET